MSCPEIASHEIIKNGQKKEKKGIVYPKSKMPYVRRGVLEMTKIVSEIEAGLISKKGACFKYGLCRGTLRLFLQQQAIRNLVKYSALPDKQINMPDTQQTLILNKRIQSIGSKMGRDQLLDIPTFMVF